MITREKVREITADILAALNEVEKRHGVEIKQGSARFTDKNFTVSLTVSQVSAAGLAETPTRVAFCHCASSVGLSPSDLDQEITLGGHSFRISGFNSKAKKYCIEVSRQPDGKVYKATAGQVKHALSLRSY